MPPHTDSTDTEESTDEATTAWPTFERRPLLKALGVGAALSLGSGVAAGEQDGAEIDPHYGYPVQNPDEIPGELRPDHEVSLAQGQPRPESGLLPIFVFEPVGLHVSSGDIVQFTFDTPDHTVTAYHEALGFGTRVPEEAPPFSSPVVTVGGAWLYRFDEEGVYDLYCGPHHVLGMVMRIVVGDLDESEHPDYLETPEEIPPFGEEFSNLLVQFSDEAESVEWVFPTPRDVLTASAMDPDYIQTEGAVPYSAVFDELVEGATETTTR